MPETSTSGHTTRPQTLSSATNSSNHRLESAKVILSVQYSSPSQSDQLWNDFPSALVQTSLCLATWTTSTSCRAVLVHFLPSSRSPVFWTTKAPLFVSTTVNVDYPGHHQGKRPQHSRLSVRLSRQPSGLPRGQG